jgi:predicted transcriptional regulator
MITYIYQDELDDYLSMGYSMDQLHIIDNVSDIQEVGINEVRKIVKDVLSEAFEFDNNKSFTPPYNVSKKASEALSIVSSNNLTQKGTNEGSGLQKAKDLSNKKVHSHEMMKRLKAFFDNNAESVSKERSAGKTIKDSGVIQSWELHGGDEAKRWVDNSIAHLKDENLRTKKNLRQAGGAGNNKGMGIFDTSMMDPTKQRTHR